ncbi:Ig-like domain-containing protein [Luteolibacter arcticus]|uniref:Ig-like domain-containing protein n=1 Tax=Luteolibacter arcticus TaxID=1581411 RepID=UPI0022221188|nr:Ig-like domain-containing protein [Luteolibacter arcticus]
MTATAAAPVGYDDLIAAKADTQVTLDYLLLNDKDADGNTLSITATTSPAHGTLTSLGGNSYRYTPTAGYKGRDSFTYTVSDGTSTDTALVSISVNAAYDVTAARDTILAGVTELADPTQPARMAVWGPTAASISNYPGADETNPMIATATMGAGRVVVLPDHQWLNMNSYGGQFTTGAFYQNSISWIANTTSKSIAIVTLDANVNTWLTAQGYTNVTTTTTAGLAAALPGKALLIPGWLGNAPSAATMTTVKDYIQGGGGYLCCDYASGYVWWWNKKPWEIPLGMILREAGISFFGDGWNDGPFTINRAANVVTGDTITTIFQNPASYTDAQKLRAASVAQQVIDSLHVDDSERARMLQLFKDKFAAITPTPLAPVTDAFQRKILEVEGSMINVLPPAQMTAHRAALPVSAGAPRVTNATFGLVPPAAVHDTKTIYTPFYAAPGELVTIQFPAALTAKNLDVRVSHLRSGAGEGSYPVMPVQMINYDVASTSVQVANPHGGLIQIIVPSNTTWTGTQNITVTGAVQAPYFKLGETTDAQWVAGIRDRGTPFGVLDSAEATLVIDADKWLRTLPDPAAVITEWNYFCGKVREFYAYNAGRQLPMHHDYYPAGGVSTYPQSYGLTDEITNSLNLKASAYALTLHEYGHICDSGNIQFDEFGETSPNMGGKWLQETERKYSWKQWLVVGRVNNYLGSQSDDLWHNHGHHAVHWKGTPFDILSSEFGPAMIQQSVAAMTAMASIPTSQGKIDEWARQLSNRSGRNVCAFLESWQILPSAAVKTELSGLPAWMPVERAPESLTVLQGSPVVFVDPSTNDFSYDGGLTLTGVSQPGSGTVVNNGNGTYTYTPAAGFTGSTSFTYTVTNATGNAFITTVPVKVVAAANDPKLVAFDGVAHGSGWTTVTLDKSYTSMVVIAQPMVGAGSPPLATRIRNASGSSFEVRLDRLDGSATPAGVASVRYLVVEEGVYNQATHGIKMEAVKFTASTTDRKSAFTGTTRSLAYTGYDHYYIPAVFGQVMTANDNRWSAFWYDVSANSVKVGKHVGEDTVTTRANETVGYIVMESGSYQFGNDQIQVGMTSYDAYAGFDLISEGGASHNFVRFPSVHSAQVSASVEVPWGASDPGLDGFVTMQKLAGGNSLSAYLAEDAIGDAETSTGGKGAAYLLAHRSGGAPIAKADQVAALTARATLIRALGNDDISGTPVVTVTQQPANGAVTVHTDGNLIYTSNAGFTGSDAFVYSVTNAQGSSTSVVNLQVSAVSTSLAGIKADRFNGITGGSISDLTGNANYPASPSTSTTWTTVNSGQDVGDNIGHHVHGYVVPPTTGDYTFWIASDDNSEVYLSSDGTSLNLAKIASVSNYTAYQGWDQQGSQKSAVISLQGGRAYFLRVLHKEGGGGDHVSVAWEGPGFARKLLANPDIFTPGNTVPVLAAAPANTSMNEGTPKVVSLAGVFTSSDAGDPLTIEVHGNTRPDLMSTSIVGNTLTVTQAGFETGSAVITLRATDRTNTLVTTSFTVTLNDTVADSDGDGLTDSWEVLHFSTLAAQSGSGDPDGDGLNNTGELAAGANPNQTDSDADGFGDGFEVARGSNPASASSKPNVAIAALWKFDNTGTPGVTRDEVGVVPGSLLGGAVLSADGQGRTGLAGDRSLDLGTTDAGQRVEVTAMNFLQQAAQDDKLTISFWQKLASTGVQRSSFWAVSPTAGDNQRGIQAHAPWSTGVVYFDCGNSSAANRASGTPASVTWTNWNHIALVKDGVTMRIWVNGNLVTSESGKQPLLTDFTKLFIGSANGATSSLRGKLDDFAVFTTALTPGQIANLVAGAAPQTMAPNTAPSFTTDPIVKSAATEDAAYSGSLAADVSDPDAGDTKTYTKLPGGPAWLNVASNGALSGTPTNSDVGPNSFTVRVTDATGDYDEATVSITVTNTNDAPVFDPVAVAAVQASSGEAIAGDAYSATFSGTASDVDGDSVTFTKQSGPGWLVVGTNGTLSGTPAVGDEATTTVTIRATDPSNAWAQASFDLTVFVRRSLAVNYRHSTTANTAVLVTENTNALNTAVSLNGPVVWNNQEINGTGGLLNGRGAGTYSGVAVSSFSSVPYQAGSASLSGSDASQRVFRYYLDDGDAGSGYFNGDGVGASIHLTGLTQFLAASRATNYTLTLLFNADSTSATPFLTANVRNGVPAAPSATAISSLPSLGIISPQLLGDGKQPLPAVDTVTSGKRGWGRLLGLTANNITIAMPVRSGSTRGSVAGFIITPVGGPVPLVQDSYAQWQGIRFGASAGDPAITDDEADPNGDGVANLLAYTMGIDPLLQPAAGATAAQRGRLELVEEDGTFHFDYQRDVHATAANLVIEQSEDLADPAAWIAAEVEEEILSEVEGIRTIRVRFTPEAGKPHLFLRLRASR